MYAFSIHQTSLNSLPMLPVSRPALVQHTLMNIKCVPRTNVNNYRHLFTVINGHTKKKAYTVLCAAQ